MASEMLSKQPILFYDGDCPLCNRVVTFILDHERDAKILFSALNSAKAIELLRNHPAYKIDDDTVYFFDGKELYNKSTAVLKLFPFLKRYLFVLRLGWFFPRGLRDSVYDYIAKRRKRIVKECTVDVRLVGRTI